MAGRRLMFSSNVSALSRGNSGPRICPPPLSGIPSGSAATEGRSRCGSGIIGLIDRVETLGGKLTLGSPVGDGTSLVTELPLEPS